MNRRLPWDLGCDDDHVLRRSDRKFNSPTSGLLALCLGRLSRRTKRCETSISSRTNTTLGGGSGYCHTPGGILANSYGSKNNLANECLNYCTGCLASGTLFNASCPLVPRAIANYAHCPTLGWAFSLVFFLPRIFHRGRLMNYCSLTGVRPDGDLHA